MTTTDERDLDGCECGVEEPDEFCPHHGRSHKEIRAEVERLRGERGDACDMCQLAQASAEAERDRLRAVLAETDETLTRVACAFNGRGSDSSFVRPGDLDGARAVLAALRARAGEPTPRRPLQDLGRWQCSGCHWVFKMPWRQECPECHRTDYWTGSVAPDGAVWPGEPTP